MVRNTEKISVSISIEALQRIDEMAEAQNRKRSNVLDTIVKDYFGLISRKKRPMARGTG